MSPQDIIERLSKRYGVPQEFGRRMLPLLERAQVVAPPARKRILDLVERSYAHEAQIRSEEKERELPPLPPRERRLVAALAESLHGWEIPKWLDRSTPPGPSEPNDA